MNFYGQLAQFKYAKLSLHLHRKVLKMIMKPLIVLLFCITAAYANAQYYYKDFIVPRQAADELARLKEQKIRKVAVNSYESNGQPSEGFYCEKKINKSYTETEIVTEADLTPNSYFFSNFSKEGVLLSTTDSTEELVSSSRYLYNENGQLTEVVSITRTLNDDYSDDVSERHIYKYNTLGLPEEMLLIKNEKDSTYIVFQADESKHVGIEKNSTTKETYYYYYNSKGWISDIVHNYANRKELVTDFTFEYNRNGQVIQMIASEDEGRNYITWKYNYENGLRIGEKCFSKYNRLLGTIEYVYK